MSDRIFIELDLAGAEWVVTAYLANDANMIGVIKSGKSPHIVTGALISGAPESFVEAESKAVGMNTDPAKIVALRRGLDIPKGAFLPRGMSIRQAGKKSNHGLNYGMKHKRFALENEIEEKEAAIMVELYSNAAYPGLKDYWLGIREELRANKRCLENCFGRKVRLLDEWGPDLFMQAYSYKPQSTVVDVCLEGMCKLFEDESDDMLLVNLGAQVHDSLLCDVPYPVTDEDCTRLGNIILKIKEYLSVELSYNGHKFTLGIDLKVGRNWGEMKELKKLPIVPYDIGDLIRNLMKPSSDAPPSDAPESQELEDAEEFGVSAATSAEVELGLELEGKSPAAA